MQKYSATLLLVVFLICTTGCDKKDIVSPLEDSGAVNAFSRHSEPEWLSLPAKSSNNKVGESIVSKLVRADKREFVTLSRNVEGGKLGSFRVASVIVIPKGALDEDVNITMMIDEEKGFVTILPELNFNVPAKFTMILKGVELKDLNPENIKFVNFDESSGINNISSSKMKIDKESGTIGIYEALINSSSKYGFIEK